MTRADAPTPHHEALVVAMALRHDGIDAEDSADLEEAIALSDRVVVLSAGPGTRPIGDFRIDLPRPRSLQIKTSPEFNAYTGKIREIFEGLGGRIAQRRQRGAQLGHDRRYQPRHRGTWTA